MRAWKMERVDIPVLHREVERRPQQTHFKRYQHKSAVHAFWK